MNAIGGIPFNQGVMHMELLSMIPQGPGVLAGLFMVIAALGGTYLLGRAIRQAQPARVPVKTRETRFQS